jgi:hypothetical protein
MLSYKTYKYGGGGVIFIYNAIRVERVQCQAIAVTDVYVVLREKYIVCILKARHNFRQKIISLKCEIPNQRMCAKCKFRAAIKIMVKAHSVSN